MIITMNMYEMKKQCGCEKRNDVPYDDVYRKEVNNVVVEFSSVNLVDFLNVLRLGVYLNWNSGENWKKKLD